MTTQDPAGEAVRLARAITNYMRGRGITLNTVDETWEELEDAILSLSNAGSGGACDRNAVLEEAAQCVEKRGKNNRGIVHPIDQKHADAIRALKAPPAPQGE